MRNASKNTIKKVMRNAKASQDKGFWQDYPYSDTPEARKAYYLFNDVGAQIYRMSKGKICNRSLSGLDKYMKPNKGICIHSWQSPYDDGHRECVKCGLIELTR